MDNFRIDVTSCANLKAVVEIALAQDYPDRPSKVVGYRAYPGEKGNQDKKPRLVFYWTIPADKHEFEPFPSLLQVGASDIEDIINRWLKDADYGRGPDHDGDNKKGWRLFNERWRQVGEDYAAMFAVEPAWATYGK